MRKQGYLGGNNQFEIWLPKVLTRYLVKTEILSVLYNIKNFLLFHTKFAHERVEKGNLQIILFVGQQVINAR